MSQYPEIILGAIYEVDCNSPYNEPDDWVGTCRVVKETRYFPGNPDSGTFWVERISGLRSIHTFDKDIGGYTIGVGSRFHQTMRLMDASDENVEIKFSFDSLIGGQHE